VQYEQHESGRRGFFTSSPAALRPPPAMTRGRQLSNTAPRKCHIGWAGTIRTCVSPPGNNRHRRGKPGTPAFAIAMPDGDAGQPPLSLPPTAAAAPRARPRRACAVADGPGPGAGAAQQQQACDQAMNGRRENAECVSSHLFCGHRIRPRILNLNPQDQKEHLAARTQPHGGQDSSRPRRKGDL
jgi:hypothetical protein